MKTDSGFRVVDIGVKYSEGVPELNILLYNGNGSEERIFNSIVNAGYEFPYGRYEINIAPGILTDEITPIESAIAAGILLSSGRIKDLSGRVIIGGLDGKGNVCPVKDLYEMTEAGRRTGFYEYIVPYGNLEETAHVKDCRFGYMKTLKDISGRMYEYFPSASKRNREYLYTENVRRAFEIAIAGRHDIVMYGDDTMCEKIARGMTDAFPPLSEKEKKDIIVCCGNYDTVKAGMGRPFRKADGNIGKPDEKLAGHGILYIHNAGQGFCYVSDENTDILKVICIPPHKYGSGLDFRRYLYSLPERLINSADIHVPAGSPELHTGLPYSGNVINAVKIQENRYRNESFKRNSSLNRHCFAKYCRLTKDARDFLDEAVRRQNIRMQDCEKAIRLARTIADLEDRENIGVYDVAEAVGYIVFNIFYRGRYLSERLSGNMDNTAGQTGEENI